MNVKELKAMLSNFRDDATIVVAATDNEGSTVYKPVDDTDYVLVVAENEYAVKSLILKIRI